MSIPEGSCRHSSTCVRSAKAAAFSMRGTMSCCASAVRSASRSVPSAQIVGRQPAGSTRDAATPPMSMCLAPVPASARASAPTAGSRRPSATAVRPADARPDEMEREVVRLAAPGVDGSQRVGGVAQVVDAPPTALIADR
jgi:hypothetical protein